MHAVRRAPLLVTALCACTGTIATPAPVIDPFDPGTPAPLDCPQAETLPGAPVPMRRLNHAHVELTVRDVLGVSAALPVTDERLFTYRSNVSASVDSQTVQAYFDWAEGVVSQVSLAPCTPEHCEAWLFDELAPRLFRRPLEGEQRDRYVALYQAGLAQGGTPREGAQWVLESMLQSPSFLYLDEPTSKDGYLDGYGVATRLSLMLWGKNPDSHPPHVHDAVAVDGVAHRHRGDAVLPHGPHAVLRVGHGRVGRSAHRVAAAGR